MLQVYNDEFAEHPDLKVTWAVDASFIDRFAEVGLQICICMMCTFPLMIQSKQLQNSLLIVHCRAGSALRLPVDMVCHLLVTNIRGSDEHWRQLCAHWVKLLCGIIHAAQGNLEKLIAAQSTCCPGTSRRHQSPACLASNLTINHPHSEGWCLVRK